MKRKNLNLLLLVGISAAVLVFMLVSSGPTELADALLTIQPGWIGAACGLMLLFWLLEAQLLHVSVRTFRPEQRFRDSLNAAMIGQLFNCLTPFSSGGQPIQALYLSKTGVAVGEASCALIVKFIVYQVVLTFYSMVALLLQFNLFSTKVLGLKSLILLGFGINLAVVLGLFCICRFRGGTQKALFAFLRLLKRVHIVKDTERAKQRAEEELDGFYGGFLIMRRSKKAILHMAWLTFVQLTVLFLIPYVLYSGFGLHAVSALSILATTAFGMNITAFIPTPGAAGGAEVGFYTLFSIFFPRRLLNASLLLWRGVTFYLPILVGVLFTLPFLSGGKGENLSLRS